MKRSLRTKDQVQRRIGYGDRVELVYVDFMTRKGIPKLSAVWYREPARHNAVV